MTLPLNAHINAHTALPTVLETIIVTSTQTDPGIEHRSLNVSKWANLFMGVAGVTAALLSNSQAILVDGLFSLVGFTAAVLGQRINRTSGLAPDRRRPFGYYADESAFTTFRALSLLGLVAFGIGNALLNIAAYIGGRPPPDLRFEPMLAYFLLIGAICFSLWAFHQWSWRRGGRRSEILRMEAKAALFDGAITLAAAVGLAAIYLLRDGFLAPIAPIGDSLIVIVLCAIAVSQYWTDFLGGLGELVGVSASPKHLATARRAGRKVIRDFDGDLIDLSVLKFGRRFIVTAYVDPKRPVVANEFDELTLKLERELADPLGEAYCMVVLSQYGRTFPPDFSPDHSPAA